MTGDLQGLIFVFCQVVVQVKYDKWWLPKEIWHLGLL